MSQMNPQLVGHVAQLANIPVTSEEEEALSRSFVTTLRVVDKLMDVNTRGVNPTHQVTGLENVWREDEVDETRTFSQAEALQNAKRTHEGCFVVPLVLGM